MSRNYYPIAFTDDVLDAQEHFGSRSAWGRRSPTTEGAPRPPDTAKGVKDALTDAEQGFLASLDGFFVGSVSSSGWPYVQFRGGPRGFVQSPDPHTIAWADYRGNRQYISAGNLAHDPRVALFFLDYPRQLRLKVYGRAAIVDSDNDSPLAEPLRSVGYAAKVEREVRVEVTAYDWNCAQHIVPRYTAEELAPTLHGLQDQIAALEAENERLRSGEGLREDF